MAAKLIIGRDEADGEVFIDANMTPSELRKRARELRDRGEGTFVTYSFPFINEWTRFQEDGPDPLQDVYVAHPTKGDLAITSLREPAWLVHFRVAELWDDEELFPETSSPGTGG